MCPQLAKIEGLANGSMSTTGLTRYTNEESKMVRYNLCTNTAMLIVCAFVYVCVNACV